MIKNFSITPAARDALRIYMLRMGPEERVATVLLAADVKTSSELGQRINSESVSPEQIRHDVDEKTLSEALGPYEWSVAFYLKRKIPANRIIKIEDIEFFIDELWH